MKRVPLLLFVVSFLFACGGDGGDGVSTPVWEGIEQFGASGGLTWGTDVAIGSDDSVYVAGTTDSDLHGEVATGTQDMLLVRYNSAGERQWSRLLGVAGTSTTAWGLARDSSNNLYVAGTTGGDLDGNTLTGLQDGFLTKYSADGTRQWTQQFGVTGARVSIRDVATDSSDNIYVAGSTNAGLHGNVLSGTQDFVLIKFNAAGVRQWTQQMGAGASTLTNAAAIAIDGSQNIYIGGNTDGNLDGQTLNGSQDGFVSKYDAAGNKLSTTLIGDTGMSTLTLGIAVDSSNNMFVSGYTGSGSSLHGVLLTGLNDGYLIKYSSAGVRQWTVLQGVASLWTQFYEMAFDSTDNIYLTGVTFGAFTGNTLTGDADAVLMKFDTSGTRQWVTQHGSIGQETYGYGIAKNSQGKFFTAGEVTDYVSNPNVGFGFVAKHDSAGNLQ